MKKLYSYETAAGTFLICRSDRVFFSIIDNEIIGSYSTPEEAAGDLARGEKVLLESGNDPSKLEFPLISPNGSGCFKFPSLCISVF